MPDRDPLPEFCRYSLWKEYQGVAMHFNDLLLRLRSQSLAAVAAFAAIASAILRNSNESAPLWGALTGVFGLLILFWIAIWVLDLGYYNRLLLGAVQALISIEKDSAGSGTVDKIILSTEIDKMVVMKEADFQSEQKGSTWGVWAFYIIVTAALSGGMVVSAWQWW